MLIDKTLISLISILIGILGVFSYFAKYEHPELHKSYFGMNPYKIKKNIIDKVMNYIFIFLTLISLLIKIISLILFKNSLPNQIYSIECYILFTFVGFVFMYFIFKLSKFIGRCIARKFWFDKVIESQRELFEKAKFIIENDGFRKDQLKLGDKAKNSDECKEINYEEVDKILNRIEDLLEISSDLHNQEKRIKRLEKHF